MSDVEHELLCGASGLLVVRRSLGALEVTGKDQKSWLNGLVTQDLVPRKAGDAALALVVAKNGKIEAEVAILLGERELTVGLAPELVQAVRDKLDRHLIMEDAAIEPSTEVLEWVFGFGPGAEKALSIARDAGARAGLVHRGDLPMVVIASSTMPRVLDALTASVGDSKLAVASEAGWLRFRIEHGIAERGADYTEGESYPQEAALEKDEVSFSKGCYLGQEAVFMLEKRGHVSKRLVQLEIPTGTAFVGAEVRDLEGGVIGKLTSVAPRDNGSIALGMVKYKHARAAHEVRIGGEAEGVGARVTSLLAIASDA